MNEYPPDWKEIADRVKEAAGWRCVCCGHPNQLACDAQCVHPAEDHIKRVLTVHHLDDNKSNSAWWNLAALCQACHLRMQGRRYPQPTLFGTTESWLDLYIAGRFARHLGYPDEVEFVKENQQMILAALHEFVGRTTEAGLGRK